MRRFWRSRLLWAALTLLAASVATGSLLCLRENDSQAALTIVQSQPAAKGKLSLHRAVHDYLRGRGGTEAQIPPRWSVEHLAQDDYLVTLEHPATGPDRQPLRAQFTVNIVSREVTPRTPHAELLLHGVSPSAFQDRSPDAAPAK